MKILIAEDEIYSRKSMVKQIEETDIFSQLDILEAENGQVAWEVFLIEKPDIVISDIRMPLIDGIQLLQMILEEKSDTKILMVSGYADFDYAYNALNYGAEGYMLKPVNDKELQKYLNKFLNQNEEQNEKNLLNGQDSIAKCINDHINEDVYLPNYLSDSIIKKIFPKYKFLIVSFTNGIKPESDEFIRSVKKLNGSNIWTEFRIIYISNKLWAIIIRQDNNTTLFEQIERYFSTNNYNYYIGVSDICSGVEMIKIAYSQAMLAIKSKVFYENRIIYFEDVDKRDNLDYNRDGNNNEILWFYLQKSDLNNCYKIVEKTIDNIFQMENVRVLVLENYLTNIVMILQEVMLKAGIKTKYKIEVGLVEFNNKEEIIYTLKKWINFICNDIKEREIKKEDDVVSIIVEYINKNYNNDISLKDIAEKILFLNYSYISHKFKEQMGLSYSNYLKKIRIEKAKNYLENKNISITDVAMLTGYNDVSGFIQVFKKVVGMTPKSYRDSQINQN